MPKLVQWFFPKRIWAFPDEKEAVFLTFDDGPIAEVTPWVLDELKKCDARATFFCIGENIQKNPGIFRRIFFEGHSVGNHTFNHLNGWRTGVSEFVDNVFKCQETLNSESDYDGYRNQKPQLLFRPPYGKIKSKQAQELVENGYKIVMWDLISYDFDAKLTKEKCLKNVLGNIGPGSIVVFHDSLKAEHNLRYVLPKVLDFVAMKGWTFARI